MISKELCEAINVYLYIPMHDNVGERLLEVINALVTVVEMSDVHNCSRAFFRNEVCLSYKVKFQTQYKNTYGEDLVLPDVVFKVLETCQVLALLQSDDIEDELKAKTSLIIRNNAIWRKDNWNGVLCPTWIEQMYACYPKYGIKDITCNYNYDSLLQAIVPHNTWNDTDLDINVQETYNQLRSLCKSMVREQVQDFANTTDFKCIVSPFTQVYLLVSKMVAEWHWKYVDHSPVKMIIAAMGDSVNVCKMLRGIVSDLKKELSGTSVVVPKEKSSVLLFRIYEDMNMELDARKFSVLEFGVYLYYELLLENYND